MCLDYKEISLCLVIHIKKHIYKHKKDSKEALERLKKASQDKTVSSAELNKYTQELANATKKGK